MSTLTYKQQCNRHQLQVQQIMRCVAFGAMTRAAALARLDALPIPVPSHGPDDVL